MHYLGNVRSSRYLVSLGAISALSLLIAASPACTSVTNTTAVQCTSEAECLGLGPAFAGTTCDKVSKTCVQVADTTGSCTTNQQCLDEAKGKAAICRKSDKKCITLTTDECPVVMTKKGNSELADDNVIVIGAMTPVDQSELGTVFERSLELAHLEISSSTFRGLPPAPGSTANRPIAVVACREFLFGREGLLRAADHLVNTVKVPLVIGPADPSNVVPVATQYFLPNRVLTIAPVAPSSLLATLPSPISPTPLIWRLNSDDRQSAKLQAQFILNQLEPAVIARQLANPTCAPTCVQAPIKVAFVQSNDSLGNSAQPTILANLKFNGTPGAPASAEQNQADGKLKLLNFGDVNDTLANPNPDGKIGQIIGQLVQYRPDIIIHMHPPAALAKIIFGIEGAFAGAVLDAQPPIHVSMTSVWNGFAPLHSHLNGRQYRSGRFFAFQNFSSQKEAPFPVASVQVQSWLSRFNDRNPEFSSSPSNVNQPTWSWYDAMYLAAYSIVALGDKPVTGENLAGTMKSFTSGTTINTYDGPTGDLDKAFGELRAGRPIDLNGLLSNMSFDLTTGVALFSSLEVTCPQLSAAGLVTGFKGSGFRYRADVGKSFITGADGVDNPATGPLLGCPQAPPP